jgi:hypothetical protein
VILAALPEDLRRRTFSTVWSVLFAALLWIVILALFVLTAGPDNQGAQYLLLPFCALICFGYVGVSIVATFGYKVLENGAGRWDAGAEVRPYEFSRSRLFSRFIVREFIR